VKSQATIRSYLLNLWDKKYKELSLTQKALFLILCFFEQFYKILFYSVGFFKSKIKKQYKCSCSIISVGNLSVGGTGKSVFTLFLLKNLYPKKCAVVLRGYKGQNEKTGKSFLVSDGNQIFCTPEFCGDEAFMIAQAAKVPVVVGRNRAKSCRLLESYFENKKEKLDFIILDDAYQNFSVKKDFEFLLLDARRPFENGHCLPAGKLREKNYSRADFIILTHADLVSSEGLEKIKKDFLPKFDREKILSGMHEPTGLIFNEQFVSAQEIGNKKFLVFAGIGSFDQFVFSVKKLGARVGKAIEFPDHHDYSREDLELISKYLKENFLDGAITTQKDFVKIFNLLKNFSDVKIPIYVLNISFDFLDKNNYYFLSLKN
jgi:tetraacyldisaccharide 4'-kinase